LNLKNQKSLSCNQVSDISKSPVLTGASFILKDWLGVDPVFEFVIKVDTVFSIIFSLLLLTQLNV
jgi:hypothetical protein